MFNCVVDAVDGRERESSQRRLFSINLLLTFFSNKIIHVAACLDRVYITLHYVNVNVRVLVLRDFVLNRTRKRAQVMLRA